MALSEPTTVHLRTAFHRLRTTERISDAGRAFAEINFDAGLLYDHFPTGNHCTRCTRAALVLFLRRMLIRTNRGDL